MVTAPWLARAAASVKWAGAGRSRPGTSVLCRVPTSHRVSSGAAAGPQASGDCADLRS